jgi:hypothetical protein
LKIGTCFMPRPAWILFYSWCCHWDNRCMPTCQAFSQWDGVLQTFLSKLVWSSDPPNLSLPCSVG